VLAALRQNDITVAVSLIRAQRQGWIPTLADYPLRRLYDERISLVVGTDMPGLYHTTINDEYAAAVDEAGLAIDELENLALNAVRSSFLAEAAKAEMLETFTQAYAELRAEHIAAEAPLP
jgi:adenosine deaminase